jgi:hypothetical protein
MMKPKYKTQKISLVELSKLQNSPFYEMMKKKGNPKDGLLPLERLEKKGYKIEKRDNGDLLVVVGFSNPNDVRENMFSPVKTEWIEQNEKVFFSVSGISSDEIVDYNSLWEITKTGWYSDKELPLTLVPYLVIENPSGKTRFWRWDNQFLRGEMGIYNWTEENFQLHKNIGFPREQKDLIKSLKSGKVSVRGKDRNKPCLCGSGIKTKKCCLINNQIGHS